jgi:hypothetical protein
MHKSLASAALLLLAFSAPSLAQTRPPAQIALENRRAASLTELTVADADGNVVGRLARPIAGGKKSVLKLTRPKGCEMAVQAKFDDEGEVEETINFCREKVLRFTE